MKPIAEGNETNETLLQKDDVKPIAEDEGVKSEEVQQDPILFANVENVVDVPYTSSQELKVKSL